MLVKFSGIYSTPLPEVLEKVRNAHGEDVLAQRFGPIRHYIMLAASPTYFRPEEADFLDEKGHGIFNDPTPLEVAVDKDIVSFTRGDKAAVYHGANMLQEEGMDFESSIIQSAKKYLSFAEQYGIKPRALTEKPSEEYLNKMAKDEERIRAEYLA